MRCLLVCLSAITLVIVIESKASPSFYDAVPVVSQTKFVILYMLGYKKEAQQVYANFNNMTHLFESVKTIDESIPVWGHTKALIAEVIGDHEHALRIFEAAHRSTCVIIGSFVVVPPIGGSIGLLVGDSSSTIIENKPVGIFDHAVRFDDKTASEHIDIILDITLAASTESDLRIKLNVEKSATKGYSLHFRMEEVGHPVLLKDQSSFTSRLRSSSKAFSQVYTPMDHVRKNDTINYLRRQKYRRFF